MMQNNQTPKLILLNGAIIALNIITFSQGVGSLSLSEGTNFQVALGITLVIMSIIVFLYGNYHLLQPSKRPPNVTYTLDELDEPEEFVEVLKKYQRIQIFREDISMSINQIEILQRKRVKLDEVLFQAYSEDVSEFGNLKKVVDDTCNLMYENLKKMIKRLSLFDEQEYIKIINNQYSSDAFVSKRQLYEEHIRYVKTIVNQNEAILLEFDNLLVEISKADDFGTSIDNLDSIKGTISAMKSFRTGKNELSDLEAKYDKH